MLTRDAIPDRTDLRAMAALALPVVGVQLGLMLMGVADTIMVGHVSRQALASAALGNLYFYVLAIFGTSTLMALDPVVSQAVGAEDEESVARALQRGALIALALVVLTTLAMLPAGPVLDLARQPADVVPDAVRFIRASIPGVLPFFAFALMRQLLQATGSVRPVLASVAVCNLLNIALNWVFIYGHLGAAPLGVRGSAISTSISRWAMAILLYMVAHRTLRGHLTPWRRASFDPGALKRMARLGVPIGAQYALEYGAFAATALLMGVLGTTAMAAHQVAINLASLTFMVPLGISAATAVLVGQAIGARDEPRARRAAVAGLACGALFMVLTAIAFLTVPRLLATLYTGDDAVIELASRLLPIAGVFQVFDGAQGVASGVLRGVGDTHGPAMINVLGFWLVGLPACAVLAFTLGGGPVGVWWGIVVGLGVVAMLLLRRVRGRLSRALRRLHVDEDVRDGVAATG